MSISLYLYQNGNAYYKYTLISLDDNSSFISLIIFNFIYIVNRFVLLFNLKYIGTLALFQTQA